MNSSNLGQRLKKKNLVTDELINRALKAQEKSSTKLFLGEALVNEFKMAVKKALEADPVNITEISNRVKGHPF